MLGLVVQVCNPCPQETVAGNRNVKAACTIWRVLGQPGIQETLSQKMAILLSGNTLVNKQYVCCLLMQMVPELVPSKPGSSPFLHLKSG